MGIRSLHLLVFAFFLPLTFLFSQGADNQVSGTVIDATENYSLIGATVMATNQSTGFSVGVITDNNGRFLLQDLPLGGPYSIRISYLGYASLEITGNYISQGDYLDLGVINLEPGAEAIEEIVVTYDAFRSDRRRLGTARQIDERTINRIPSPTRNYNDLAQLSPLTRGTIGAGGRRNMTNYSLDGVSNRRNVFGDLVGGAFPVSMEAIREFEVASNNYDVTNGRGGGASVRAVTKSGTNNFEGSVFGYYSGNALTGVQFLRDPSGERFSDSDDFTVGQIGFSLGGPIIKDRLHFFVTADYYQIQAPWSVEDFDRAGATLTQAEQNIGIRRDLMDEIAEILEGPDFGIPVPPSGKQYGTLNTTRNTSSILAKLDYQLNDRNLVTLRYNYHTFHNPNKRKSGGLLSTQYEENSFDHSVLLSLRTILSPTMTNDLRISYADVHRPNELIYPRAPVGRVRVNSDWEDGTKRSRWIYWGNQYWIPEIITEQNYQLINNFRFQSGNIRYTFGMDFLLNQINDNLTHFQQGEFFYEDIEALRENRPYRYERKTPMGGAGGYVRPRVIETGLYGQMQTTLFDHLDVVAGLRWDATFIPVKPTFNQTLYDELGVRNDVDPLDLSGIQPRLNLIWDLGGRGNDIIKLGGGRFVNQFTTQPLTMSHIDNGVDYVFVIADLNMPGFEQSDIPKADWPGFFQDFDNTIPGEEYVNELLEKGLIDVPAAFVIVLDEDLKSPKTWKFNANYHHYFNDRVYAGIGVYYNRTIGNYYYRNINLNDAQFTLASEGNREVYVPFSSLEGEREANFDLARRSDKFTQVMQFTNADWPNTFVALVAELNMRLGEDGNILMSYTRGASKGGIIYNSGNSREFHYVGRSYQNWGNYMRNFYDADDLRHKVVVAGILPTFHGFSVGMTFIGMQANRFSAGIGGSRDIVGVNVRTPSDNRILPYIFDPNDPATPEYLRDGINAILQNAEPEFADYIRENIGSFAEPFGGLQPWRFETNISIAKTFNIIGSNRLELRADIFNVLNLLNREWGGFNEIYNTNIYSNVEGFDAEEGRWEYAVNTNAGQKRYRVTNPYQVHLGLRYSF